MTSSKKALGVAMAVAAAGMLSTATPVYAAGASANAKVQCFGVNKCAGQNDCKTAHNACKGQGSCKGQGFLYETPKACKKMGGKIVMNGKGKMSKKKSMGTM